MADGRDDVRLAGPALAEHQQIGAGLDPAIACGEREQMGFARAWSGTKGPSRNNHIRLSGDR